MTRLEFGSARGLPEQLPRSPSQSRAAHGWGLARSGMATQAIAEALHTSPRYRRGTSLASAAKLRTPFSAVPQTSYFHRDAAEKEPDRRVRMNVSKFAGAIREWRVTRARAVARLIAAGRGEISRFWRDRPGACRRRPVLARAMIRWSQGDQRGIAASHRAYQG